METLILIIFFLTTLSFTLQLKFVKHILGQAGILILLGVFIYGMHTLAIEQSYKTFRTYLGNDSLMLDFVVILVIEALLGVFISIYLMCEYYQVPVKRFFRFGKYLPSLVILPSIFAFESMAFLKFTGIEFSTLAFILAILIPVFLFAIKQLIIGLIPEFELQLELKFIIHILQLLAAVTLSILLFKLPVAKQSMPNTSLKAILVLLGLLILGGVVGTIKHHFKIKRIKKTLL